MTSEPQAAPRVESIVGDLWRSFFGTVFDALRRAIPQPRAQHRLAIQ